MIRIANSTQKISFDMILAAIIILWLNAGFFTIVQLRITRIGTYGIVALWFLIVLLNHEEFFRKVLHRLFYSALPIVIGTCIGNTNEKIIMVVLYVFFLTCIADYYISSKLGCEFLLKVWLIDTVAVALNTIRLILQNPIVVRKMSTISAITQSSPANVCASFGNVLAYVILSLILFYIIINKKTNKYIKIGFAILVIIVIRSQIAILISAFLIGIAVIFVIKSCDTPVKVLIIGIPVCTFVGMIIYNLSDILTLLSKMGFISDLMGNKIQDTIYMINGSSNTLESQERFDRYQMSISAFRKNPFIGTFGKSEGIGGHSTWLDALGMYGFLSLGMFIWHYKLMKDFVDLSNANNKKYFISIAIVFSLIGFVDPILFQNAYMIFVLVIPLATNVNKLKNL